MQSKYLKRTRPVYGNIEVLHPEGFLMFCTNHKKAKWYLSRGLAKTIQEDPPIIQLTFIPKGEGRRREIRSLVMKHNICVCCGHTVIEEMNRHHIVPHCYRKHFPESIKENNDYDVVCICFDCHESYETVAMQLKKKLADDYQVPIDQNGHWTRVQDDHEQVRARKAAVALMGYRDQIPQERIQFLESILKSFLKKDEITQTDYQHFGKGAPLNAKPSKESLHGHLVVKKMMEDPNGVNQFFQLWRKHFIEFMKPKFMPQGWNTDLPISYPQPPRN